MRSLRDKLGAVVSAKPKPQLPGSSTDALFFCREHRTAISALRGVELTTLQEVRSCDPGFTGASWNPYKLLFLDTETTGLSGGAGTVAFEIGLGWLEPDSMVIRQYVMRDYHEEAPMLAEIASIFTRFDTVVSFNGKSFDLPLLESRMTMNRIRLAVTQWPHFDLLHAARRVYKLRLGRCNLAALEEVVFGMAREGDLPGAMVPQRYFDYLKTQEFAMLEDVLRHNRQDVQSLAELTGHLCAVFRAPELLVHPQDLFGVGKTLLRTGYREKGRRCLRLAARGAVAAQAHMHLAQSFKKDKDWRHAVEFWHEMIVRGEGGVWPYIELAKYYEHACADYRRALACAQKALTLSLNSALLHGENAPQEDMIRKRIARLSQRLARKEKQGG